MRLINFFNIACADPIMRLQQQEHSCLVGSSVIIIAEHNSAAPRASHAPGSKALIIVLLFYLCSAACKAVDQACLPCMACKPQASTRDGCINLLRQAGGTAKHGPETWALHDKHARTLVKDWMLKRHKSAHVSIWNANGPLQAYIIPEPNHSVLVSLGQYIY